ncbi:MAG TPA: VOC family protein [Gemmatimonadaceae bacterium]|nr:VOC family protein [Gemmatimonadaceae bacterium]
MPLDIQKLGQIAVNVQEVERATAFYRDTLGLRHLFSAPPKMSFFEVGGVRLLLGEPEKPEDAHGSALLYYQVADINAAHATLVSKSVSVVAAPHFVAKMPDHELWIAFYNDGEGNTFGLMSEMRS